MVEKKQTLNPIIRYLVDFLRRCLFGILSMGEIPNHIAFIMDGNRRYSKKHNLENRAAGYKSGRTALLFILKYCCELKVKYVIVFAFSIDNFKRNPKEVESLMDLILKIEGLIKESSLVNHYGIRIQFVGDLKLLDESAWLAAEKAMLVTASNSSTVLIICIAYTSTNEIVNAIEKSCAEKWGKEKNLISVMDIEKHMYINVAPNPDIVVRTSGENRLSNFLLWQTEHSILYSFSVLWPEIGLRHLVWAILNFQRTCSCSKKKNK